MADQLTRMKQELVSRFHGAVLNLIKFDDSHVRSHVKTDAALPDHEFALFTNYLRAFAHMRTISQLAKSQHFQAIAMIARALFEIAVEVALLESGKVPDAPRKFVVFSDVEKLKTAQQIVAFHSSGKGVQPLNLPVYQKFIANRAAQIQRDAQQLWPSNPTPNHWSGMKLPKRIPLVGAPFDEIYNVNYADLSWYTHPGVGAVAMLAADDYMLVCANGYGVALRAYREILLRVIDFLKLETSDPNMRQKLEFAHGFAFAAKPKKGCAPPIPWKRK